MTVSVQTPYNESVANGVTTVFPFTFKLLLLSDLRVFFNGVEQLSGFTVSGIGVNSGGNVTFTTPPANLVTVLLKRELALKRDIDYQENGDLPANGLDNDIDRVWQAIQQFGQLLKASIKLSFTTSTEQIINDSAAVRANTLLGFDGFGNVVLKLLANLATTPVSIFFGGLLNLNDAIALRAATGTNPDIYTATTTGTASAYLTAFSPTLTDFSNNPTFKITFDKACADNATIQIAGITPPLNLKYKTISGNFLNVSANDILANHISIGLLINNNADLLIQPALSAVPTPVSTITANTTLTKANAIGQTIRFITNNSLVATLPAANSMPNGGSIQFASATFNNIISRAGADNIFLPTGNVTSIPISIGSMIKLTSDGVSLWYADIIPSSGFLNTFVTADAGLNVSDVAVYDFVAQTSMALKLLTATDQMYEIDIFGTYTSAATGAVSILQVNNTNFAAGFTIRQIAATNATATATNTAGIDSGFRLEGTGASVLEAKYTVFTRTASKKLIGVGTSTSTTTGTGSAIGIEMADVTTVWTSLGTVIMPNSWTGRIRVKRVM